jgi:hypothetical protein
MTQAEIDARDARWRDALFLAGVGAEQREALLQRDREFVGDVALFEPPPAPKTEREAA